MRAEAGENRTAAVHHKGEPANPRIPIVRIRARLLGLVFADKVVQAVWRRTRVHLRRALEETFGNLGKAAVRWRTSTQVGDAGTDICLDHIDAWRRAWLPPSTVAALLGAGIVWSTVAIAMVRKARRVSMTLNFNVATTVVLKQTLDTPRRRPVGIAQISANLPVSCRLGRPCPDLSHSAPDSQPLSNRQA